MLSPRAVCNQNAFWENKHKEQNLWSINNKVNLTIWSQVKLMIQVLLILWSSLYVGTSDSVSYKIYPGIK